MLLSPTFPPGPGGLNPAMMGGGGGFDRVRKIMIRKTVDYHCSVLRYLEVSEVKQHWFLSEYSSHHIAFEISK